MSTQPPATPAVLALDQLGFAFAANVVLDSITLSVDSGEVVALLGPNGAGKSTLIRCICGRLPAAHGTVRIDGRNPRRDRQARSRLGLVPQRIALHDHLTAEENLLVFGRLSGVSKSVLHDAVQRTLTRCGLHEVARQRAGTLSGGWQRRLNIACALVHDPALLVLDEPTVGIDPPACAGIEELLRQLAADGVALLMTSHDLPQLERLADRVAFLRDGRIVDAGPPAALINERFDDRLDCLIQMAGSDTETVEMLSGLGLERTAADSEAWQGLIPREQAEALGRSLPSGPGIAELRIRRPGLDALWRSHYGIAPGGES